jgi:hypothetical protein
MQSAADNAIVLREILLGALFMTRRRDGDAARKREGEPATGLQSSVPPQPAAVATSAPGDNDVLRLCAKAFIQLPPASAYCRRVDIESIEQVAQRGFTCCKLVPMRAKLHRQSCESRICCRRAPKSQKRLTVRQKLQANGPHPELSGAPPARFRVPAQRRIAPRVATGSAESIAAGRAKAAHLEQQLSGVRPLLSAKAVSS